MADIEFDIETYEPLEILKPAMTRAQAEKTMYYVLAYPSKEAADRSWKAFREDPDWIKAKDASEKDGKLVERVESIWLAPTDYSPIK